MKKGTLNKIGKGWQIVSAQGKSISVMGDFKLTDDMAGKEIEFDNTGGPVQKIVLAGKTYLKVQTAPVQSQSHPYQNYNQRNQPSRPNPSSRTDVTPQNTNPRRDETREMAPSPYNFVSLNQTVVPSNAQEIDFSVYDGLSGYIDVTVTTQTPMFIRGIRAEFFKIGEQMAIPGSSFRGLIRTMVEMMSYGKFVNFEDRELYHRLTVIDDTKAEKSGIRKKIGFLYFDKSTNAKCFKIYEAKEKPTQYERDANYSRNEFTYEIELTGGKTYVKINTGSFGGQNHLIQNFKVLYEQKENTEGIVIDEKIVKSFKEDDTRKTKKDMANLLVLAEKPKSFIDKLLRRSTYIGVPIWYEIDAEQNIVSFGHCKNYRVPYDYSIGNHAHIPANIQNETKADFAESIFGKSKGDLTASKVYFEDLKAAQTTVEENILNTLATPKPTAYQMYLEQDGQPLKTWSNEAKIRGNKQYWHRDTNKNNKQNWRNFEFRKLDFDKFRLNQYEKDQIVSETIYKYRNGQIQLDRDRNPIVEIYKTNNYAEWPKSIQEKVSKVIMSNETIQFSIIQAIPPKTSFTGRIRFDNLSPEELGALLCALNLPAGCCHKIGMGKPLGLGSIRVEAELSLINRKERYKNLFDMNGNWNEAKIKETEDIYKKDFSNHIFKEVGQEDKNNATSFWDLPRMKELKKMLTFDTQLQADEAWLKMTRYQIIQPTNEFKLRPVLPKSEEVK